MLSRNEEGILIKQVADVLKAGFVKQPSPIEKSTFEPSDCQAAAKDVVDMILGGYHIDPKDGGQILKAAEDLKKSLSEPSGLGGFFFSAKDSAGYGGGTGEAH